MKDLNQERKPHPKMAKKKKVQRCLSKSPKQKALNPVSITINQLVSKYPQSQVRSIIKYSLGARGITETKQLRGRSKKELLSFARFGPKCLQELERMLEGQQCNVILKE